MRNNIKTIIQIPQYANLTMYPEKCNLSVTFHIKDSTIEHVKIPKTMFDIHCFHKNNKGYITARLNINYNILMINNISLQDCVYHYSGIMCNQLRIILKEAKIRELKEEIIQLSLF